MVVQGLKISIDLGVVHSWYCPDWPKEPAWSIPWRARTCQERCIRGATGSAPSRLERRCSPPNLARNASRCRRCDVRPKRRL